MRRVIVFIIIIILLFTGMFFIYKYSVNRLSTEILESQTINSPEIKKIRLLHWGYFSPELLKKFSEKYPDITVEFEQITEENYSQILKSRMVSGESIDLIGVMNRDYPDFIRKGYLTDLSGKWFLNHYPEEVRHEVQQFDPQEREFAIAYQGWVFGIWYNKILFENYNLDIPKNYGDFLNVCRILKKNGITPLVIGARDQWASGYLMYLVLPRLIEKDPSWFLKLQKGQVKWTDPGVQQVFAEISSFINRGYLKEDSFNLTYHQAFMEFANSRAAMTIMKDTSLNLVTPDLERVCEPGVFPIPYTLTGTILKAPGVKADFLIGVYSESKHKKEAEKFLEFLSSPEIAQIYLETSMAVPTIPSVDPQSLKYYDEWSPLRNMAFVSPGVNEMNDEVRKQFNAGAKELIMDSSRYQRVLQKLQAVQEGTGTVKN